MFQPEVVPQLRLMATFFADQWKVYKSSITCVKLSPKQFGASLANIRCPRGLPARSKLSADPILN
jgi:hypothetical protein